MIQKHASRLMLWLLLAGASAFARAELPAHYQTLPATIKQSLLWQEIESTPWYSLPPLAHGGWSSILAKLSTIIRLNYSFDHHYDEMPQERIKPIFAYGSVAKVEFNSDGEHPFTGVYAETSVAGLARLSLAGHPERLGYTPGLAVKFLVDAQASVNLLLMHSMQGQGKNQDFFAKTLSNRFDGTRGLALRTIMKLFDVVHSPANDLPLHHLASLDSKGQEIQKPIYPSRIFFGPAADVSGLIAEDTATDFREELFRIEPGAVLYNVGGLYEGKFHHIGTLTLTSPFLASVYGDRKLFFQHQR